VKQLSEDSVTGVDLKI